MENLHGNSGSHDPNDNTNLRQVKDSDVIMTPCGSCEGCSVSEDCGTRCENCVKNYIQTAIENNTNPNILPCLKRMCRAGNIVNVRNNNIKDEQEMKLEKDSNIVNMQPIQTELDSKLEFNETVEMEEIRSGMEHGETGFKKSIKLDETSSEENLIFSEGDNDGRETSNVEMCGICLGCTAECGDCWTCIQREVIATKDLISKMVCQKKKCLSVKEGIRDEIKKLEADKVKHQKRKRCGTCPGCVVAQNCGNCAPCIRRQRCMNEGTKFHGVCNARRCHALKIPKSRCGEFNSNPFQSNKSNLDKKTNQKKAEIDDDIDGFASEDDHMFRANNSLIDIDQLTIDRTSKLTKVDKWLNENVQFEDNLDTDKKNEKSHDLVNLKSLKRTKKCGECSSCEAEDCGDCRSCKINDQFSDSLVLGKVPCLTNVCEFPVELTGDMDAASLMSLQDDSSNGTVCPVKIVNGVLYDFRCFFCKKLPRVGSTNRSELMRHYSNIHYSKQLRKDYEIVIVDGHCLLCDSKLTRRTSILSHIGQKHDEVVNYLPLEAVALCPKVIQKERKGGRHHLAAAASSSQTSLAEVLDWPQIPKGFDPSSKNRNWKGNNSSDSSEEIEKEDVEIVDGWIIEHVTNSDEELPDSTLDYSGVGGRCSVCQREFDEITNAALHLHEDHNIKGGSSYLMKDCQNFIKSGFIQVSKAQNEILPTIIEDKVDDNDSDCCLDFEAKRYVAKKATSRKSWSSSTLMKEQITRGTSQHSSSNDEETSDQCNEIGMELLPSTIHDKADENSTPSRNVARKSTGQKSWAKNSQHSSSNDEETSAQCVEIETAFLPATIHNKPDTNSKPSRNVARKSTGQKSWFSSTLMKEKITRGTFQHTSSTVETSAQCDEIQMELLPAVKADDNSKPSRNVARKSTGQKSRSSTSMKK